MRKPNTRTLAGLLIALISFTDAGWAAGQKVLYLFQGGSTDGIEPESGLIFDKSGNLYGTTVGGGSIGGGTAFELSPNVDGSWSETILYNFCSNRVNDLCADGYNPQAGLVMDANGNLYGTTVDGGMSNCPDSFGCGTAFELSPPPIPGGSWTLTTLYSFCQNYTNNTCIDGFAPVGGVALDSTDNVYGTTIAGGAANNGVVYELSSGSETVLYSFCKNGFQRICPDGSQPYGGVTIDSLGNLYGTTKYGGSTKSGGGGTIYKLSSGTGGWIESALYTSHEPFEYGCLPLANVSIDSRGDLFTTMSSCGPSRAGSVVKISQSGGIPRAFVFNQDDGLTPGSGALLYADAVYGTTTLAYDTEGNQVGNVFEIDRNGKEIILYTFCQQSGCSDGAQPLAGLAADGTGNFYGTASQGGLGYGVVYEITP
jgi:uncharacterized repeat protein (TIGR03803 family)